MQDGQYRVLFLSRRNSARSILAEALLNQLGRGRFVAASAAVQPAAAIEPEVIKLLGEFDLPTEGLRPKHYDEFAGADAEALDFVFTLSDTAAGEALPEWPGLPITAHWRCADPLLAEGAEWEKRQAFNQTRAELERRLAIFVNLPFASLDRMSLQKRVTAIAEDA